MTTVNTWSRSTISNERYQPWTRRGEPSPRFTGRQVPGLEAEGAPPLKDLYIVCNVIRPMWLERLGGKVLRGIQGVRHTSYGGAEGGAEDVAEQSAGGIGVEMTDVGGVQDDGVPSMGVGVGKGY